MYELNKIRKLIEDYLMLEEISLHQLSLNEQFEQLLVKLLNYLNDRDELEFVSQLLRKNGEELKENLLPLLDGCAMLQPKGWLMVELRNGEEFGFPKDHDFIIPIPNQSFSRLCLIQRFFYTFRDPDVIWKTTFQAKEKVEFFSTPMSSILLPSRFIETLKEYSLGSETFAELEYVELEWTEKQRKIALRAIGSALYHHLRNAVDAIPDGHRSKPNRDKLLRNNTPISELPYYWEAEKFVPDISQQSSRTCYYVDIPDDCFCD